MSGPRARLLQWALRQAARGQCVVAFVENPTMTQLTDLQRCLAQPRLDGPSAEQVATLTLARVAAGADAQEGIAAMVEKRKPVFQGR